MLRLRSQPSSLPADSPLPLQGPSPTAPHEPTQVARAQWVPIPSQEVGILDGGESGNWPHIVVYWAILVCLPEIQGMLGGRPSQKINEEFPSFDWRAPRPCATINASNSDAALFQITKPPKGRQHHDPPGLGSPPQ